MSKHVRTLMLVHTCAYEYIHAWMDVDSHMCTRIRIHAHICIYTYAHLCIDLHMCIHTCTCIRTYVCMQFPPSNATKIFMGFILLLQGQYQFS